MKAIFHQPHLKVLSVLIAIFLFKFVQNERKVEVQYVVNVSIVKLPVHLRLAKDFDPQVRIHVKGSRSKINKIDVKSIESLSMDFSNAKSGVNSIWFHEEDFNLPFGVHISRIIPQVLRVEIQAM